MNVRETVFQVLYEVEYKGAYSNITLKEMLKGFEQRDKAFASRMVYGVISRKITLDYIIDFLSNIKLKKISKQVLLILRMGLYQILYMDKVPDNAAVNESVNLAKKHARSASGFVNGLLRSFIRSDKKVDYPKDTAERLSVMYSMPVQRVTELINDYGIEEAEKILKSMLENPGMEIRVNTLKTTAHEFVKLLEKEGVHGEINSFCPDVINVSGLDTANSELYRNGYFTVQDAAAAMTGYVLEPKPGEYVIDMCAAQGGKTICIAEIMKNTGDIRAFDIHKHKIELIEKNAQRSGVDIINAECADAQVYNEKYAGAADKVLADVPCSGLGIARRKPEIKYYNGEYDELEKIQEDILENAAKYLKKGGTLVYSTCTVRKAENERQIEKFLKRHRDFRLEDISGYFPGNADGKVGYITLFPHIHETDGFFIAKLVRRS